jgi:hypothetical protein
MLFDKIELWFSMFETQDICTGVNTSRFFLRDLQKHCKQLFIYCVYVLVTFDTDFEDKSCLNVCCLAGEDRSKILT